MLEGQSARLSGAALETLAIVAYKQPVSRAQVAAIRGVNVDGVMRTLHHRGFIDEVGKDPGPGQAVLFGTTPLFLERLGLNSLDELPPLSDFVPGRRRGGGARGRAAPAARPVARRAARRDRGRQRRARRPAEPSEIDLDEIDLDDDLDED